MKCICCNSTDIILATVKKTGRRIAVCEECEYIYDLDDKNRPIIENKNKDSSYLEELYSAFKNWNELTDIIPLKKHSV